MPPTFFPKTPTPGPSVTTVTDLANIARTPTFPADTSSPKITRILAGSDSLVYWLNSQPYDSVHYIPANIFYSMEVVRDSDGVVLWSGDTISARGVGSDTITEEVTIPVGSVAAAGTMVFIRLATMPTTGMQYELLADFTLSTTIQRTVVHRPNVLSRVMEIPRT